MTKYPKITITVETEDGEKLYTRDCSFFDIAMRLLISGQDAWLKYCEETEDVKKQDLEEDAAQTKQGDN